MKLLLKQYLASLAERGELDVILPDILSEAGYRVISRPGLGSAQYGVDVVATGPHPKTGEDAVFLLSIKSGNLGRADWDDGKQALRPSLTDILDVYIPKFLPPRLKAMPLVIALCFGGDIKEDVRLRVTGFLDKHTEHGRIEFDEWNGDRIAEMIAGGLLRENIFPGILQSDFRKAVAMVDEPSTCVAHFRSLLRRLTSTQPRTRSARLRTARQIYLATWTVFVWCRDAGNLDAAYETSTLAALTLWDWCNAHFGRSKDEVALRETVDKAIQLNQEIAAAFVTKHVVPYSSVRDGLAYSVPSNASLDVNLKLFEVLGRVALQGLWLLRSHMSGDDSPATLAALAASHETIAGLINNNQALATPIRDDHAIEITLVGIFLMHVGDPALLLNWLNEITAASMFSFRSHGPYPCIFRDYAELADHPKSDQRYREEATSGSVLYPSLCIWATLLGDEPMYRHLVDFRANAMRHSTWQLWVPDGTTEVHLYRDTEAHGAVWTDIDVGAGPAELAQQLVDEVNASVEFSTLSAVSLGFWPMVLSACRQYRLPVPPHFWFVDLPADQ